MTSQNLRRIAFLLGCISCLAVLVAVLALNDIYHGEADLSQEWMALRFAFAAIISFHAAAFVALSRISNPLTWVCDPLDLTFKHLPHASISARPGRHRRRCARLSRMALRNGSA